LVSSSGKISLVTVLVSVFGERVSMPLKEVPGRGDCGFNKGGLLAG